MALQNILLVFRLAIPFPIMQLHKLSIEKLYWIAVLAFVPPLFFYYVGEEGSFTSTALEMWHSGNWLLPTNLGADNGRPPLLYWPIIAMSELLGWHNMLLASRLVSVGATLLAAIILVRFVRRTRGDGRLAVFCGLIFLSSLDLSLYRGWLAYADPLFSLFVMAGMFALWLAVLEQRATWLVVAMIAVSCGFLSKALTAYVFYAATLFVLMLDRKNRNFLLSPASIAIHAAMLLVPLLWFTLVPVGHGQGGSMLAEIERKLSVFSFGDYLSKLFEYPLEFLLRMLPGSAILVLLWWRNRTTLLAGDRYLQTAVLICLLNFLPYWLSPQSSIRYLLPLYPLWSLIVGTVIWKCGERAIEVARKWTIAALLLKLVFVLALYPYYQVSYRGKNYLEAARDIAVRTGNYPLYANDTSAPALSVEGYINALRYPHSAPLVMLPAKTTDGFVLNYDPDPALGKVFRQYQLGGDHLTLLCRGLACQEKK